MELNTLVERPLWMPPALSDPEKGADEVTSPQSQTIKPDLKGRRSPANGGAAPL